MTTPKPITGQCHCGTIRWQAALPPKIVINCHCNMCRKLSGADYSSWVIFPASQFGLLVGEESLTDYQATAHTRKSFCSLCGSTVSAINNSKFPGCIYVARGNITDDIDLPVQFQVFTHDKAPWVCLNGNIPVFNP